MKLKIYRLLICLVVVILLSIGTVSAHYHAIAVPSSQIDGGHFRTTIRDLDSGWTPYNSNWILHAMWLATDTNSSWIEVGFTDGSFQEPGKSRDFYRGFYCTEGKRDSTGNIVLYNEYKIIGPSTSIGTTHNFDIQRDGSTTWGVYVNWNLYRSFNHTPKALEMHVGLEANNYYSESERWNEHGFQIYQDGIWKYWPSGQLVKTHIKGSIYWVEKYKSVYTQTVDTSIIQEVR